MDETHGDQSSPALSVCGGGRFIGDAIQFMRFYWKSLPDSPDGGVACKIMRAVEFPFRFDVRGHCTQELQRSLNVRLEERCEIERARGVGGRGVQGLCEGVRGEQGDSRRDLAVAAGGDDGGGDGRVAGGVCGLLRADWDRVAYGRREERE